MRNRRNQSSRPATIQELDSLFFNVSVDCPYGMPCEAVYYQSVFNQLDRNSIDCLLNLGYRRNGNCMYDMRCPDCALCVPIRLRADRFQPNRNQRRVWKKNQDVNVELASLTMSDENLSLLQRFLDGRFPDSHSRAETYYDGFFITNIANCFELRYRVNGRLLGVAIVDIGSLWLNAVYFFFDPEMSWRSPGTLNILALNQLCKNKSLDYLYLGYWIKGLGAMEYKSAFRPHELLINGIWQEQGKQGLV